MRIVTVGRETVCFCGGRRQSRRGGVEVLTWIDMKQQSIFEACWPFGGNSIPPPPPSKDNVESLRRHYRSGRSVAQSMEPWLLYLGNPTLPNGRSLAEKRDSTQAE